MTLEFQEKLKAIEKSAEAVAGTLADVISRHFADADVPVLIAVGGPGGTGKSTLSAKLAAALGDADVLRLDDYKTCRCFRQERGIFGPHPDANEMDLISEHLAMIKSDLTIDKPVYCPQEGRAITTEKFTPRRFNIIEGEVATYPEFADIIDFHIFIESDLETQLQTRLTRDVHQRGYSMEKALATFVGSNLGEFITYGSGTKAWADIVLFCDKDYALSIQEVSSGLHEDFLGGACDVVK